MDYATILTEGVLRLLQLWVGDLPSFFETHYLLKDFILTFTRIDFLFFLILSSWLLYKCSVTKSDKMPGAFFFWIMVVSYAIYFRDYWYPPNYFWDENFHVAAAAKYLNNVRFMEPHPPLGKLLIALGEKLLRNQTQQMSTFGFENLEYIKTELPTGFTFLGYRFFPSLFGWLNTGIFALLLYEILGSYFWAAIFSSFYIFDNALVVHSRAAMLEPFMIFGILCCLWAFFRLLRTPKLASENGGWALFVMIFGFTFGMLTKIFTLALILLWPMLLWLRKDAKDRILLLKVYLAHIVFFIFSGLAVWGYHITQGQSIRVSLLFSGLHYASSDYEKIVRKLPNDFGPVEAFYIQLRDNLRFSSAYEERVTQLDLDEGSKAGSFPIMWPFTSRPIPYRWTQTGIEPRRYLYLIPNIVVWGLGLMGLVLAFGVVLLTAITGKKMVSEKTHQTVCILLILYFAFMIPMIGIRRILYLYHYFVPLMISIILFALISIELVKNSERPAVTRNGPRFLALLPIPVFAMFCFFYPFTYYAPMSCQDVEARTLFRFWNLKTAWCKDPADSKSFLSPPVQDTRSKVIPMMDP